MRRTDNIIAFKKDVIQLAAKDSEFSEVEIEKAYHTFSQALKKAVASGEYTRIDIPIGILYVNLGKLYEMKTPVTIGFSKPKGDLLNITNVIKSQIGLAQDLYAVPGSDYRGRHSLLKKLDMPIEELEQRQNDIFYKNN